ncbi:hypothetical protein GO308_12885 [Sphingomonas sp. SFZ2018-12]|uniref:hypothetical protein n=1 Tax=Sphingomonas sp. SFZ2018-12 TaxID=2683197 RepID=UPI001F0DB199|nr:hypothetical protein [Sphingomonas sp. SFZ2018-12]MCH4894011.1 hypothetical protein [Sphingomonas sp. SFZ2018-12]
MSVSLDGLALGPTEILEIDFGGRLVPPLGGPVLNVDRAGSRYGISITTAAKPIEPDGRVAFATLKRARAEGAIITVPQPGLVIGSPGAPVVASLTAAGRLIPLSGLTAGYVIRQDQAISFVVGGRRYLDFAAEQVTASGGGTATLRIQNLLRVPLPAGTIAEIAEPKIEGSITAPLRKPQPLDRFVSFEFIIEEDA